MIRFSASSGRFLTAITISFILSLADSLSESIEGVDQRDALAARESVVEIFKEERGGVVVEDGEATRDGEPNGNTRGGRPVLLV
jgi:hypothetical protein